MNKSFKNRQIFDKIKEQIDNDLVVVLIGARQVGKTTIMRMLGEHIKETRPQNPSFYFNMEKTDIAANFFDYRAALNYLQLQGVNKNKTNFIFLDEFQKMPAPTQTLKILHDDYPYLKFFVSGSSSLDILQKLRSETMAGRKRVINIYPLSFNEFLNFQNGDSDIAASYQRAVETDADAISINAEIAPLWENFIIWGGYPRAALSNSETEKKESIAEIYRSYLERDVPQFLNNGDDIIFHKLTALLATQNGMLFNINEISKILDITRFAAEKYLFLLEHTFIIKLVKPFYTNKQKEIIKMPKLYFLDAGLRDWAIQNFNPLNTRNDSGQLAETAVFHELYKHLPTGAEINFWRTPQGAEVDFVLKQGEKIIPIEVKFQPLSAPKIPSGLKAFIGRYHPTDAFVLTKNFYGETKMDNCAVHFWPSYLAEKIIAKLFPAKIFPEKK